MSHQDHSNKGTTELTKYLSPLGAWALSFGCAVGWGAFVMPGTLFLPFAGPLGTVLGIGAGALVMLVIAMNYHFMMNRYPDAGGTYSYAKNVFGYDHGFFVAWFLGLTYIAIAWANATALALLARKLLGDILQFGFHYRLLGYDIYFGEVLLTMGALMAFGLLCARGKKLAGKVQTILAALLLLTVLLCFGAAWNWHTGGWESLAPAFSREGSPLSQVFHIFVLMPWAFVGFESISHSAEEFRFSTKKSFRILATAVLAGFLAYSLLAILAVTSFPRGYTGWTSYISGLSRLDGIEGIPTFFAVNASMGATGLGILTVAVLSAIITGLVGNYIGASRLLYAMARDDILPKCFTNLTEDRSPRRALLFIAVFSLAIPFVGRTAVGWIVDVLTIGGTIAYGYTSAAAYRTAKKEGSVLVRCTGFLGILVSIAFSMALLIPNLWAINALETESYLILAFWSILGFLYYRVAFKKDRERRFGKSTVAWLVMLFLIFFSTTMWMRQSTHAVMQNVVKETTVFYTETMEELGANRYRMNRDREEEYLNGQMDAIQNSLLRNSIVQMMLIVVALGVMFNIYGNMRSREQKVELEKVQAEKNSKAKTVFLSNMSHDIRTPMNAIIGYLELSKEIQATCENCPREKCCEEKVPEKLRGFTSKIETSSKHLLALINDVLEMSRIESGKLELVSVETNLLQILREAEDMFATQMSAKEIQFTVDTERVENPRVLCDANLVNRILLNLLGNAYKFTPEGGQISVHLSQDGVSENYGNYELRVKDNGIGMTQEFADTIFEAFTRERNSTVSGIQGTGLGMAITKSIVDLMQGVIFVNTAPGKGTEFIIQVSFEILPEETSATEAEETSATETVSFVGKKVLLVDDLDVNREIASMLLTASGFQVETAVNGKEALEKVAASKPGDYDLVLMDVQMPIMGGYEATRAIRSLADPALSKLPILAMTANAFSEDVQAAKEAGMDGHIPKPLDVPKMLETLGDVLKQKNQRTG